ncbi:YegP family protein [Luteolibacter yonseiensis]|nr:YegP family protein [Luteolibacter yonseiensis]
MNQKSVHKVNFSMDIRKKRGILQLVWEFIHPAVTPQPPKNMYYTVWKSTANGNWYWNLKAANHEKIATSEGYVTKQGALHSIELVKGSNNAPVIEI